VIKSFKTGDTGLLFNDERVKQWQTIEDSARRKLTMVNAAANMDDLKDRRATGLKSLKEIGKDSTLSVSTISSAFVLCGETVTPTRWRSRIITERTYE
jgi:plasmid maintenance system killer protein